MKKSGTKESGGVLFSVPQILVALAIIIMTSCGQNTRTPKRPNFIVIIADDAGWNDVGYHGSLIQTPNIDKLANQGVVLNRFYVCPTCSPTRASLLTGMPASRIGILAPISGRSEKTLPDSLPTLPGVLRKHGYQTALTGKWHLGLKPESGPLAYGFDYSYGFLHGQIDQYSHHYKNGDPSWHENGEFIEEKGHATDLITRKAVSKISEFARSKTPFFLQVAYSAPHTPLQEEERWIAPYDTVFKERSRQLFAAAMTHMDDGIGQIINALKQYDLEEETVVFFMSDNGAQQGWFPDEHLYNGRFDDFPVLGDNSPLRGWKTSVYEGGIRVPAFISWSGNFTSRILESYLAVYDVYPAFLKLAGIASDDYPSLEGIDFSQMLFGNETINDRSVYVRGHLGAAVIKEGSKLIWSVDSTRALEAYDLNADPCESNNQIRKGIAVDQLNAVLTRNMNLDQ